MSTTRSVSPGKSRRCPHCRSEILESASICPVCRHHLKHGLAAEQAGERFSALHVEGTIRHPAGNTPWEYSVTITIRNQKGEEVARQMVGIGSMSGNDLRTFDLSVDVFAPEVVAATPAPQKVAVPLAPPTSTVSAPRVIQAKQGSILSPSRSVPQTPRQTSTVSASRIIPSTRNVPASEKSRRRTCAAAHSAEESVRSLTTEERRDPGMVRVSARQRTGEPRARRVVENGQAGREIALVLSAVPLWPCTAARLPASGIAHRRACRSSGCAARESTVASEHPRIRVAGLHHDVHAPRVRLGIEHPVLMFVRRRNRLRRSSLRTSPSPTLCSWKPHRCVRIAAKSARRIAISRSSC